jgi:succinate dehydrogenase / fumarate reductase cytochrome b subunit
MSPSPAQTAVDTPQPTVTSVPPQAVPFFRSPIGKKLITGITGLSLTGFVLIHMVGNLLMFAGADAYNAYGRFIERLGLLLWLVELGLLAAVVIHAGYGINIFLNRLRSRPVAYAEYTSRGAPSLQSLSSRTMIVTGSVLAIFMVTHLLTFKFGTYYPTTLGDREVRDLARLVVEKFREPTYAFGYTAVMALLGFHLRHGIWSAFQSLGALSHAVRPGAYLLSLLLASAIAIGFFILPLAIYFGRVG